jgi:hypothetical protein
VLLGQERSHYCLKLVEAVTAVNRGMSPEEFLPIFHNAVHHRDAVPHTNSDF